MTIDKSNRKIIFASPVSDFFGGAERSMFELILNTKKHGYEPVVIVPSSGQLSKELTKYSIKTYEVDFDWWARGPKDFGLDFEKYRTVNGLAILEMVKILQNENPFICMSYTAVFPWLAYAASMNRTPHMWQVCEMLDDRTQWKLRLPAQETMEVINNLSQKIFSNSNTTKSHVARYLQRRESTIDVVYPYVDQDKINKQASEKLLHIPEEKVIISLVGNIQPTKGQLEAIKAIYELNRRGYSNVYLILVGKEMDKDYNKSIHKFINNFNLTNSVKFVGYNANPHPYIKAADIALICSHHEGFGRITVEALAIGTPVVGADSDGTKEIIKKDGLYGLLYEPGNVSMLADKIELLINDRQLREKLSKNGKKYVEEMFTLENNQKPFFDYIGNASKITAIQTPFYDITIAYETKINEYEKLNDNYLKHIEKLQKTLDEIISSKKYKALKKLNQIQKPFTKHGR